MNLLMIFSVVPHFLLMLHNYLIFFAFSRILFPSSRTEQHLYKWTRSCFVEWLWESFASNMPAVKRVLNTWSQITYILSLEVRKSFLPPIHQTQTAVVRSILPKKRLESIGRSGGWWLGGWEAVCRVLCEAGVMWVRCAGVTPHPH